MLTDEQRLKRKNGIGASDSPIIMGFSSYITPYQLYLDKISESQEPREESEQQYWGNTLESVIIKEYEKRSGNKISLPDTIYHEYMPYMFANLDGYVEDKRIVVEAKNVSSFMRQQWGEQGSDTIPMAYLVQVAHQCIVANADHGIVACLIGGNEYRQYTYTRDKELEDMIVSAVDDFWFNHIIPRKEPESITIEDSRMKFNTVDPNTTITADHEIESISMGLNELKKDKLALEQKEIECKMKIMEYMKHSETLTDAQGNVLVSLKKNKKGSRVFLIK